MKKLFAISPILCAALLLAALPWPGRAAIPPQQENRFLFLIDTASAMRGYSNAIVQGVMQLMASDMRGEFRTGDTIGLWTYNDKLHPEFPMEVWSRTNKNAIMQDMAGYLMSRHYEKQARLEKIMPSLLRVIKSSERLTIVIFFDGAGTIQGTPFDKDINLLQKKYARELRKAHLPFVTVLAAREGALFDYTINYPGLIAIPHTAVPEKIETNAPVAVAKPVIKPPPVFRRGPSIIMTHSTEVLQAPAPPPGSKPEPPVVKKSASPAAVAPAPVVKPAVAETPSPTPAPPPAAPIVKNVVIPTPAPAPVKPPVVPVTPPPQQAPPPVVNHIPAPAPPPAVSPAPVPASAPIAAVNPSSSFQSGLFAAAFALLVIALALVLFMVRRSRTAPQASLISQSIDRPR